MITDEDYVHFNYLDMVISQKEQKEVEMRQIWERFIISCKHDKEEQFSKFKDEGPKKKKLIEQSLFAEILNKKLENAHAEIASALYRN